MTTYWHVAPATFTPGDDLLCWDVLSERGVVTADDWKWDEAPVGHDGYMICLFTDDEQGRRERDWLADDIPGAVILRVDIEEDDDIVFTRAQDETYTTIRHSIPARHITVVA